jgi:hypothetical protein
MKRLLIGLLALGALSACGAVAVTEALPSTASTPTVVESTTLDSTPTPAPVAPTTPERLRLHGITAPVVPLTLDGGALVPPADPTVLGWWGKDAGARHGVTLLTGHTVHDGGGDLDDLEDVPVGATATVSGIDYEVASVKVISKDALARQAPRLFGQSGPHRLVIVTCEGYDPATGRYDSNVVLTATRTS